MGVATAVAVGGLAMSAYGASQQMQAGKAGSKAAAGNAIMSAMNAGREAAMMRYEAEEAKRIGALNSERVMASAREFQGSQRVLAAASGWASDDGGTSDILQQETENLARADAMAILFDAGSNYVTGMVGADSMIKTGASNAHSQMKSDQAVANAQRSQAMSTLLGGMTAFAGTKTGQNLITKTNQAVRTGWGNLAK